MNPIYNPYAPGAGSAPVILPKSLVVPSIPLVRIRNQLISKGMIWSPSHGDTAFTVPLFDAFMKRIMPDNNWKNF